MGALLLSSCSSGDEGDSTSTTGAVVATTTTTEPPFDYQGHAESLLVGIRSEGDFLRLDSPGAISIGAGSGVVVSADGLVLTNASSVIGADRINVYVPGEEFPLVGELDAAVECANLALVRVDHTFSNAVALEEVGAPVAVASVGQGPVVAGLAQISAAGDVLNIENGPDLAIGGVVFDEDGRFAGLVTRFSASGDAIAIRSDSAAIWIRKMRQREIIQQLGFTAVQNTEGQAVIAAVGSSGPGADLGLAVGDIVSSADGDEIVGGIEQLCEAVGDGAAQLEVIKDGRRHIGTFPDTPLILASSRTTDQIRQAVVEVNVTGVGTGTGFFVSEDGLLVTNYHVAGSADQVSLQFDAADEFISGQVMASSACADLAIIQAEPGSYQYLEWAPEPPKLEEPIRVVGFPRATETISFQDGIVAKESTPGAQWGGLIANFETSAVIDNGNSGGPVVSEIGEVLGVTYAARGRVDSVVQNSLHLVGVEARDVVNGLLGGAVSDPGFTFGDWEYADWVGSRIVQDVAPYGPAAAIGLRSGDALAQYGDLDSMEGLDEFADICAYVQDAGRDAVHDVIVYRANTDSWFDGQINGSSLREWPDDFTQSSKDGTITARVPGLWADYEAIEPTTDDDLVGFFSSPDMADYYNNWGVAPGMRLMWSYQRGEKYTTESWFGAVPYADIATGPPEPIETYLYTGHMQYFETPGGSRSVELAVREVGDPDGPLILLYFSQVDPLLTGSAFRTLDSLYVEPPPPHEEE